MIRLTADLDTLDLMFIQKIIKKVFVYIPSINKLELNKSNSKGYHLIVWSSSFITKKDIFILRELIGDDKNRIRLDKIRGRGLQTLFNRKEKITNTAIFGVMN